MSHDDPRALGTRINLTQSAEACKVLDVLCGHREAVVEEALEEAHDLAHFTGLAHWVYLRGDGDVVVSPETEGQMDPCSPMMRIDLSN